MELNIEQKLLSKNDETAAQNRLCFNTAGVFVINIVGSPGAGKTALLESLIEALPDKKIGVIEGDLATSNDAERIRRHNVPVIQINTVGGCHLDAAMIASVLPAFKLKELDFLIIENVGNLVCPCDFDLGEKLRILVLSLPEGEDKAQKYPNAVLTSDIAVLNKLDLVPYLGVNAERMRDDIINIKPIPVIELSARSGQGINVLAELLLEKKNEN